MKIHSYLIAAEPPSDSPGFAAAGLPAAARRVARVSVLVAIAVAFVEVAFNPAAAFSAIHFWLALFLAAAACDGKSGDPCRS